MALAEHIQSFDPWCERHTYVEAESTCQRCGYSFCENCLVYSFGRQQHPYCVSCAIAAAGIRRSARIQPRVTQRASGRRFRRW